MTKMNKADVTNLYINKKMTRKDLATHYGVRIGILDNFMRENNIYKQIRTPSKKTNTPTRKLNMCSTVSPILNSKTVTVKDIEQMAARR